ncbi:hypothetical protein QZH41_020581, partial [Actinostola sp. cb2023]
ISQSNCDAKWLPSVAIAGSVLLKQRDSKMNATASIIGVLLKTKSMELLFKRFVSGKSDSDICTLYADRNLINRRKCDR